MCVSHLALLLPLLPFLSGKEGKWLKPGRALPPIYTVLIPSSWEVKKNTILQKERNLTIVAASEDSAERTSAAGRLDRFTPASCHQAENSVKSTSPLPSLAKGFDFGF